jgi:hypothetical protein
MHACWSADNSEAERKSAQMSTCQAALLLQQRSAPGCRRRKIVWQQRAGGQEAGSIPLAGRSCRPLHLQTIQTAILPVLYGHRQAEQHYRKLRGPKSQADAFNHMHQHNSSMAVEG